MVVRFEPPSSPGARMKVGQKTIVRWIAKRAAKRSEGAVVQPASLRELSADQQRRVGGGNGSSQLPKTTW
jgi:hypothetical protein